MKEYVPNLESSHASPATFGPAAAHISSHFLPSVPLHSPYPSGGTYDLVMKWGGDGRPAYSETSHGPLLGFRLGRAESTSNIWFLDATPDSPDTMLQRMAIPVAGPVPDGERCSVCLGEFEKVHRTAHPRDCLRLSKCPTDHFFHKECILAALKMNSRCPNCLTVLGAPHGTQPQGTMSVELRNTLLPGVSSQGTFVIRYSFPSGRQDERHPNPGQAYHGTTREAYLPSNPDGCRILRLLMKAWDARIIFTVGTSVTTGRDNSVVWNGIHHKTNISGGPTSFGYPDPTYLTRVEQELVAAGITE